MDILVAVLTVALLAAVIAVVSAPLRAGRRTESSEPARRAELEAAREAKYHEIRDTELDYRTGKLSREDYEAVDGALRAEAVEILNQRQALELEESGGAEQRGETDAPTRWEEPDGARGDGDGEGGGEVRPTAS